MQGLRPYLACRTPPLQHCPERQSGPDLGTNDMPTAWSAIAAALFAYAFKRSRHGIASDTSTVLAEEFKDLQGGKRFVFPQFRQS